jgi:hypothetical protein
MRIRRFSRSNAKSPNFISFNYLPLELLCGSEPEWAQKTWSLDTYMDTKKRHERLVFREPSRGVKPEVKNL